MKKALQILLILIAVALITIQFIRPSRNSGIEDPKNQLTAVVATPAEVQNIFKVACIDCHSNTTHYPWYEKIQPVAWILEDHIIEGKEELNFSEFTAYPAWRQYKKLKEIGNEVREGEMPLLSYSVLHKNARLNKAQKGLIQQWVASAMNEMESRYSANELKKPE